MGGYYYHSISPRKLIPLLIKVGITHVKRLDEMNEKIIPINKLSMKFDVIHLNDLEGHFAQEILRLHKLKIFVLHGSLDMISPRRISRVCQKLREINSQVESFVVASNYVANAMERLCNFRPIVIHHGIDISLFNPRVPKGITRSRLKIRPIKRTTYIN